MNVDQIGDMGPALIGDSVWTSLFDLGQNHFNGITVDIFQTTLDVNPLHTDQRGNPRPVDISGDIGAIEIDN